MAEAMDEPVLNWKDYLSESYHDVPLHALKSRTVHRLGLHLDQEVEVDIDSEYGKDFTGLADLIGFDGLEIQSFERAHQKGKMVLQEWMKRSEPRPTLGRLMEFLAWMEREDILTDLHKTIESDAKTFLENRDRLRPVQHDEVSQGPGEPEDPELCTADDVFHGKKINYDAFVCYHAATDGSEDLKFVNELIQKFEGPEYNFRLFVPNRNDLVGLNSHSITAKIISERCRHMIVVLSKNFLHSQACDFQTSFAHALSPGARSKRIVPVKLDDVATPNIMKIMAVCDFAKRDLRKWAWDRLARSIQIPLDESDFQIHTTGSISFESSHLPVIASQPSQSAFGEINRHSMTDSAIGSLPGPSGQQSGSIPACSGLPSRHTVSVFRSSGGLSNSSSTESLPRKQSKTENLASLSRDDDRKCSSNPNLVSNSDRGRKRGLIQRVTETFTRKKKGQQKEEIMETVGL